MSQARRVVHVIAPEHSGGGAESVIAALASAQRATTHVVALNQLAAASDPPHPFPARMRARGVAASEIRRGRRQYAAEGRALADLLRELRADVVHSHGYHGDVVAWLATRRLRIPRVATVHGYIRRNLKEHLFNVVDKMVLRRFDAVIAVSSGLRDELVESGLRPARVHVIENGFAGADLLTRDAARARLGVPGDAALVGWIGRLSPEKGPDLFLDALARASSSVRAVLIGEGPERPALEARIAEMGVADRVALAGFQPDAAALLPAFDALALTSRTEGTPMVVLEAVAAGVPVVAFAVGGIPSLLDADMAWLVQPGNVAAMTAALEEALASTDERARRAQQARTRLGDRLSVERWVERVNGVYAAAAAR